jgi:T4 RnlA family RNA ligase
MNLCTLKKYYEEGWLIKQTHPTLPLTIWNYSQQTQYEGKWDGITLQCRGLVTDDKGVVVARPFKKFFNMEEEKHISTQDFEVYEKMDGSMGILFMYGGEWIFASRGSFTSEQAIKGRELLNRYDLDLLSPGYTYLFEIIYDANRIVVDYAFEDVVLLGCIEITDGGEIDIHNKYYTTHFNVVKKYDGISDYSTLKGMIKNNAEGFVICFSNGDRMKIKGDEYLRLHKIMTEISTKSVWECLMQGDDIYKLLEDIPDEFFDKIEEYVDKLESEYMLIEAKCLSTFNQHAELSKKEFAEQVKWNKYPGILFRMYNNKNYSEAIWKIIKPEFKKL